MTAYENVIAALERVNLSHKDLGGGKVEAQCPSHDDRQPSLSVSRGEKGVLLHCQAGCETADVVAALGLTMSDLFDEPSTNGNGHREVVAAYDYVDEEGRPLFGVARLPGKDFRQRRPDGSWGIKGVRRVLYRLPQVIDAVKAGKTVWIAEGEKDVHALEAAGQVATTNPGGAGKWRAEYGEHLRDARVAILADKDAPGRKHARQVAASLAGVARQVKVGQCPDHKDIADHLAAGRKLSDIVPLPEEVGDARDAGDATSPTSSHEPQEQDSGGKPPSMASRLVGLAKEQAALFGDESGTPYAAVPVGAHTETWPLRSRALRSWLARQLWDTEQRAPGSQAVQDAIAVLEGEALFGGDLRPVFTRVAQVEDAIYLDLADDAWSVVKITSTGWQLTQDSAVHFRRPPALAPLPHPEHGGSLEALRDLLNTPEDDDFRLIVAWLVQALRPSGPYPVLGLHGEHGTAKSTTARALRKLIDPSAANVRSEPRNTHDLIIAASNGWVVNLDNLSHLQPWLSDALCRLSTGGGFSTRELYSDAEEIIFNAQRPAILNGISEVATRADLLDRSLIVTLPTISKDSRRAERAYWADFEKARPKILGAVLDAVSTAIREEPGVTLPELPRLADFAIWVSAAEPALPWKAGEFLNSYTKNREVANEVSLEDSPLAAPIRDIAAEGGYAGSASHLLPRLADRCPETVTKAKTWPKSARTLSADLRRLAPNLRDIGITVTFDREPGGKRARTITITQNRTEAHSSVPSVPSVPNGSAEPDSPGTQDRLRDASTPIRDASPDARDASRDASTNPQKPQQQAKRDARDARDAGSPTRSAPTLAEQLVAESAGAR